MAPDTAATCPTTGLPMEQCTTTLGLPRHPTTRCTYCEKPAAVRLFRANGTDMDVCQDHVAKAVDGVLAVPRLYDLATGREVTITVTWHIT